MTIHAPLSAIVAAPAPRNLLSSRAMLAGVRISVWSARKLDRKVTEEVNSSHGAASDAGRYNKALIAKDALASVTKAASEARNFHYARTLPWLDEGARILPAAAFDDYSNRLRRMRADFAAAADAFVAGYPSFVADARNRLNGMFNAADYPAESEIRARFTFDVRVLPVPDASDFRVDIADAQAADIKAAIEASTRAALEAAMRDAWDRVLDVVGRMAERCSATRTAKDGTEAGAIFRDSLVDNVRELAAVLPSFNLTNDPRMAEIAERMARDLGTHDAADLRESDRLRKETAKAAQSILDDVRGFIA